jgi:predicted double-glycine peptidase
LSHGDARMQMRRFFSLCLGALVLSLLPRAGLAGQALMFMPGGGTLTKEVESFKERRLRQVVPQTYDYSCGAASMATLLHYYYGRAIDERRAIMGMFTEGDRKEIRQHGFSMLDMKRYALGLHFQAEGFKFPDVETLKRLTVPAIVLIDTRSYKHFVVLRQVVGNYVYVADPSWGNRRMTLEDFARVWNDNVALVIIGKVWGEPPGLLAAQEELTVPGREVIRCLEGTNVTVLSADPSRALMFNVTLPPILPWSQIIGSIGFRR